MSENITTQAQQLNKVAFRAVTDAIKFYKDPRAESGVTLRASTKTVELINGVNHTMDLCPSTMYGIPKFKEFLEEGVAVGAIEITQDFDADGKTIDVYRVVDDNFVILVTGHVTGPYANVETVKYKMKSEL